MRATHFHTQQLLENYQTREICQSQGTWRERIGRFPCRDSVDAGLRVFGHAGHDRLGPERMGRAWAELMKRLGYTRYVAQGGDWSAFVVDQMGLPPSLRMDSLTQT